jgi:NADPH:quinone reductase
MSRVLQAGAYGGVEQLEVVDVPLPEPGEGQVRVTVLAAAVNPADAKLLRGEFGRDEAKLPLRIGSEVAGIVDALGAGVTGIAVGDEVVVSSARGGYADDVIAVPSTVFPKPEGVSFEEASGLLAVGTTAWHLLEATGVGDGDTVLVHGASGGVGSAAVQLAVLRGARVIGTAGRHSFDRVRDLGAEPVEYGAGLLERVRALGPVTVALDTVGTDEAVDVSLALVDDRGRIATIVAFERANAEGFHALGGGPGADPGTALRRAAKPELLRLAGEGRFRMPVSRTFPLAQAADALRFLAEGHPGGKVVLLP